MSLLYANEHLSCIKYVQDGKTAIARIEIKKGEEKRCDYLAEAQIVFLLEGEVVVSCNDYRNRVIQSGEIFLLPAGCSYSTCASAVKLQIQLCKRYSLIELASYCVGIEPDFHILKIKPRMRECLQLIDGYIQDGIGCYAFQEQKCQELFYLLRVYYTKEELAALFEPLLGEDLKFKEFVLQNHLKAKNVVELAQMANYSTSGFTKRFMRYFDEPPYQWMIKQKSKNILHDLYAGEKTIPDMVMEYDFSSYQHFWRFCKAQYGATPNEIRKGELVEA